MSYSTRTHVEAERRILRYRVGHTTRDVLQIRPLCGRWMYDEGQFVGRDPTCGLCQRAIERREKKNVTR